MDLESVLDEVAANNDEFDTLTADLKSLGDEESAAIASDQAATAEADEHVAEIDKADSDMSAEDEEAASMEGAMVDAQSWMQTMDADSNDAAVACETAEAAVSQAGGSLLAFEDKISKT